MERVCFRLQVRLDRLDDYRARHRAVWPVMQQALRESGWRNYTLFLADDGQLIGYLETDDFEKSRDAMAATEVNTAWQTEMAAFFLDPAGRHADDVMSPLVEVFHLD